MLGIRIFYSHFAGFGVGIQKRKILGSHKFPAMSSCRFFILRPWAWILSMRTNDVPRVWVPLKFGVPAATLYADIYTTKYPHEARPMIQYLDAIMDIHDCYGGDM